MRCTFHCLKWSCTVRRSTTLPPTIPFPHGPIDTPICQCHKLHTHRHFAAFLASPARPPRPPLPHRSPALPSSSTTTDYSPKRHLCPLPSLPPPLSLPTTTTYPETTFSPPSSSNSTRPGRTCLSFAPSSCHHQHPSRLALHALSPGRTRHDPTCSAHWLRSPSV